MSKMVEKLPYETATLVLVFGRTKGRCHICHRRLRIENYSSPGREGAWEVEHLVPRADGGSDHINNLLPACMLCHIEHGATRPPFFGVNTGSAR